MDAPLAISIVLALIGGKFALRATQTLRSKEVREVEDRITFSARGASFTKTSFRRSLLAFGLFSYCMAVFQYLTQQAPSSTGPSGLVNSFVYQHLGNSGLVMLWVIAGVVLLTIAAKAPKL